MSGKNLKKESVRHSIWKATWNRRRIDCRVYLSDRRYYCPTEDEVRAVLRQSRANRHRWTKERFDCDDFAKVLIGHFAEAAYERKDLDAGFAVGMILGQFPKPHAMVWWLTPGRKFRLIEPASDRIRELRKGDRRIRLIMG